MKHVFICNPKAGKKNCVEEITNHLKANHSDLNYEVYETKCVGDALEYVRNYEINETTRFYACGGDGTLNEVVSGASLKENVEIACIALGSGNDFVKYFSKIEDFRNIDNIINGKTVDCDLMKSGNRYCINICNFGLDAWVAHKMNKYKHLPLVSGPMAYNLGVVYSLLFKMKHNITIKVDGKEFFSGDATLCAISNGICYGGGYYCTPNAKIDDGLLDICLVKKIGLLKASGLIKKYKQGVHLEDPKLKDIILFTRGKNIEVSSKKSILNSCDGEISDVEKIKIDLLEKKIKFVIPNNL